MARPRKSKSSEYSNSFEAAYRNVRRFFPPSPLTYSSRVSEIMAREIYFKWDNKLRTGSFKERGAVNFLLSLTAQQRARGVCAASAGNHALALSYYAKKLRVPCTIVMPEFAPLVKVEASQRNGAAVLLRGGNFDEAYEIALQLARRKKLVFIPPFDHPLIVAGQGTAGTEIVEQLPDVDTIVVPVGGGGLISGIASAVKSKKPSVHVVGVQSEWAVSAQRGKAERDRILPAVTIADGIAVKKIGKVTAPIIKRYVDALVTVNENQIANGIIRLLEFERTVVEGAGAAAFGALLAGKVPLKGTRVAVLACGSNIDMNVLSRLIGRDMAQHDRLLRVKVAIPDRPGSLSAISGILAGLKANVLEVSHDRSFSKIPGDVDVSFLMEVRNRAHRKEILIRLRAVGLTVWVQD